MNSALDAYQYYMSVLNFSRYCHVISEIDLTQWHTVGLPQQLFLKESRGYAPGSYYYMADILVDRIIVAQ